MWAERVNTCCLRDFPTALEYGSAKYEAKLKVPVYESVVERLSNLGKNRVLKESTH